MPRREDAAWIVDMLHVGQRLVEDFKDVSYEEYLSDSKAQRTALYDLGVLGEARGHLSDTFKEEHNHLPWHQMRGLRNRLVHEYFNIDHEIVWQVLMTEIPDLLPQLENLRNKLT